MPLPYRRCCARHRSDRGEVSVVPILFLVFLDQVGRFSSKNRNVCLNNGPNQSVIYGRVLMGQLIAEVDNPSRSCDRLKGFRGDPSKRGHRFANDNELPFDGGADETVPLVILKTKV